MALDYSFYWKCLVTGEKIFSSLPSPTSKNRWSSHDIVAKVRDCNIIVNKFKFNSSYYIHFQTNTLEQGMYPLILSVIG